MATETLRPIANGSYIALSRNTGTQNYQCVDEVSSDDDSTYVYTTSTSGQRDLYDLPAHSAGSGTINSVTVKSICRRTSAGGGGTARLDVLVGGSLYTGSSAGLGVSYAEISRAMATSPATGAAWTWGEIDAMEAGVNLVAPSGYEARCTQLWVEVDYTPAVGAKGRMLLLGVG